MRMLSDSHAAIVCSACCLLGELDAGEVDAAPSRLSVVAARHVDRDGEGREVVVGDRRIGDQLQRRRVHRCELSLLLRLDLRVGDRVGD